MRRLFTALPFALLPLFTAGAQADEHQHASLGTHEHGVRTSTPPSTARCWSSNCRARR